jgi:hypothetical protein
MVGGLSACGEQRAYWILAGAGNSLKRRSASGIAESHGHPFGKVLPNDRMSRPRTSIIFLVLNPANLYGLIHSLYNSKLERRSLTFKRHKGMLMVLKPMVSFSSIDTGTLPVRLFPGISSTTLICILQAQRFRRRMIVHGDQPLPGGG